MSESSNMLFVTVFGKADALGNLTGTNAATNTFAGAGIAVGFAAATAVAEGTTAAAPHTDATTDGLADGGSITSSETSHWSFGFPDGPTPVSVSGSMTRRTVSAIFCLATHCLGWRVLPFTGSYNQNRPLGSYRSRTELS
jgi:hypothetical protein